MNIHFYGTGASEGVPALFCECENCRTIRKLGGKNYRMRTSVQIDRDVLIDFSMDSYAQTLFRGLDLTAINHLLITHSHEDHYCPTELLRIKPPMAFYDRERVLHVYGNKRVNEKLQELKERYGEEQKGMEKYLTMQTLLPFEAFDMGEYRVTPLPANHDRREDCFIYAIEHEGKTLLYGHDSAMFGEETWQGLKAFSFDCVVLDCTMVERINVFKEHMGFPDNIKIRERMLREGMAREDTLFVATHFVHTFNPIHERITPIFREHGFVAAYDGLNIEF